jgi:hypothetical protein
LNRPDHIPEIITASLRYMCLRRGAHHTLVYVQPQYNLHTTPSAAQLPLKSFQPADNVFTRLQVSRPTWGEMLLGAVLLMTGVAAGGLMQQRARMGSLRAATVFAAALFHPVDANVCNANVDKSVFCCTDKSDCDYAGCSNVEIDYMCERYVSVEGNQIANCRYLHTRVGYLASNPCPRIQLCPAGTWSGDGRERYSRPCVACLAGSYSSQAGNLSS